MNIPLLFFIALAVFIVSFICMYVNMIRAAVGRAHSLEAVLAAHLITACVCAISIAATVLLGVTWLAIYRYGV